MLGAFDSAIDSILRVAKIAAEAGPIKATILSTTEVRNAATQTTEAYGAYSKVVDAQMAAVGKAAVEEAAFFKNLLIAIVLGTFLIAIAAAFWIALSISRGLSSAVGLANAVAIGDLSQTIAVKSNDEIGDLVTSLNTMTANLNATAAVADAIANGDLTVEAKPLSEKDTLGIALREHGGEAARGRRPGQRARRRTCRRARRSCRPAPSSCRRARPSRPRRPRRPRPRWRRWRPM